MSRPFGSETRTPAVLLHKKALVLIKTYHVKRLEEKNYLSVAIFSFAIDVRSSWLVAADRLVKGVLIELPPSVEPGGVDEVRDDPARLALALAACFAAFSAKRFCFDRDGGIMVARRERKSGYDESDRLKMGKRNIHLHPNPDLGQGCPDLACYLCVQVQLATNTLLAATLPPCRGQ